MKNEILIEYKTKSGLSCTKIPKGDFTECGALIEASKLLNQGYTDISIEVLS